MYKRLSSGGREIEWTPENEDVAEQCMMELIGETGVVLEDEEAERVREMYREELQVNIIAEFSQDEVPSEGSGSTTVNFKLEDGNNSLYGDSNGIIEVDMDGFSYDVEFSDGKGTYEVTTDKSPGGNVSLEVLGLVETTGLPDGYVTNEPRLKTLNVV
jgi:hypothetical protein